MFGNLCHSLLDAIHQSLVEQPVLHLLDQVGQIDRMILDNHQQTEIMLLDFSQPLDNNDPGFFDFLN